MIGEQTRRIFFGKTHDCKKNENKPEFNQKLPILLALYNTKNMETVYNKTIRRVYHIVAYLQVGVYHIVAHHDRNFIRKWTSGICRVRKLYRI